MRSAIDTNVISALWSADPAAELAEDLLVSARGVGGLVICGPVYSELLARPSMTVKFLDDFLLRTGIDIEFNLGRDVWQRAGLSFAQYARRRKKSNPGEPRRLLADFVIGAHALLRAERLLAFNAADYRSDFPTLTVLERAG